MSSLIVKGRLGAAEKLVSEMGVETISMSKTKALFGYAFDFTQPDAEMQTQDQVTEAMRKSSSGNRSVRPSDIPDKEEHANLVHMLREASHGYFELSQLVRLIANFREWRAEEDSLIRLVPVPLQTCSNLIMKLEVLTLIDKMIPLNPSRPSA
jgi:nuclear pore complex protein Nup107